MKYALVLLLLLATPLAAQTCIDTDTPQTCWNKFVPPVDVAVSVQNVGEMVAKTNTGTIDLSKVNTSAMRDFLSTFSAAVQSGTIEEENGAYVLDYNLPVDLGGSDDDVIKFQTKFQQPELATSVTTALSSNSAALTTLGDGLDETDDITFSVTYSPATQRFGRSLEQHRPLIESLVTAVSESRGSQSATRRLAAFANALARAGAVIQETDAFTKIDDAGKRAQVISALQSAASSAKEEFAQQDDLITAFAELLSNQEQLYFSGAYRDVDPLAGASGASIKGTYELGGKNLTKFQKRNAAACGTLTTENGRRSCLTAFNSYVANEKLLGWRIAATLDYQKTQATTVDLTAYNVANVTTAAAQSNVITLTAGRNMDSASSSRQRRIDIAASYENVTGDPNRDDRLVATFTWTQELNDNVYLPITLTFANKEKYLGAQDDQFGVHFGVSYKLTNTAP